MVQHRGDYQEVPAADHGAFKRRIRSVPVVGALSGIETADDRARMRLVADGPHHTELRMRLELLVGEVARIDSRREAAF
jgi:hypothetical protein